MAHPKRKDRAELLYSKLITMPFSSVKIVYDNKNNEWDTGKRSWLSHNDSDWSIVIQDDAVIGNSFYKNIESALNNIPSKTLVSFYVGKVRPYSDRVQKAVNDAIFDNISWIRFNTLLWGVCSAIPTKNVKAIIEYVDNMHLPYDNKIGQFFKSNHLPVYYTVPSLVDHKDDDTLTGHVTKQKRTAHNFVGDALFDFNSDYLDL